MSNAFTIPYGDIPAYIQKLGEAVAKASNGKVTLWEDKLSDHAMRAKSIGAVYARMSDGISKAEMIFSSGASNPFFCEPRSKAVESSNRNTQAK